MGKARWTTTAGLQYRQDVTHNTELSHTLNRVETLERKKFGDINELNAAAYVDEVIQVNDHFPINAGLRFDYFHNRYLDKLLQPAKTQQAQQVIVSPKLNLYYTLHFDIINDKVWIQQNNTDILVADELVERGIPKSDIVLGFIPEKVRHYEGFATA